MLAVLTKDGVASELGQRLCRDRVLPADVAVVAFGRHDQQLEAVLENVSSGFRWSRADPG